MATTIAAMKGRLGSTDYYVLAMKIKLLTEKATIPSKMPNWDNMSMEERYQRDINYKRVKGQIAPYLAQSQSSRFFGSVILAAMNFGPEDFEPLSRVAKEGLPRSYQPETEQMGFLHLRDDAVLIPLDGQHRVKALDFALTGKDQDGKDIADAIPGFAPDVSLAKEDATVILIPYDKEKARRIFTKVNRYAKATTTGENLVIDDDDIIAVLSRMIANDAKIISPDLVTYKSNSLGDKDKHFTTLATIAECNVAILEENFPEKIVRTKPMKDENKTALYKKKVLETWKFLVANIELFADALADKKETGDDKRREIRDKFLLGKPVPQACLVKAFAHLTNLPKGKLTPDQAAAKLNKIDWRKKAPLWDRVLMSGGKILPKNKPLAVDLLCYLAGKPLSEEQLNGKKGLLARFRAAFPPEEQKDKELPERL